MRIPSTLVAATVYMLKVHIYDFYFDVKLSNRLRLQNTTVSKGTYLCHDRDDTHFCSFGT